MIRRPPRSTPLYSSAASDVYKRQDVLDVAGRLALAPDLVAATAEVHAAARAQRFLKSVVVHPRDHQHPPGGGVLHDGTYQAGFVALESLRDLGVQRHGAYPSTPGASRRSVTRLSHPCAVKACIRPVCPDQCGVGSEFD